MGVKSVFIRLVYEKKKWEVCSIDRGRVFKFSKELKSDDMVLSALRTDRKPFL